MMFFICKYTPDEIITRARSWVGNSICRSTWQSSDSCVHLAAYAYGWEDLIPKNWLDFSIEELEKRSGWQVQNIPIYASALGIFHIRNHDHFGIFTSGDTMIHAGTIKIVEVPVARYMKYFKGVLHPCQ